MRTLPLVVGFAFVAWAIPATAQPTTAEPYPGCAARPGDCDPLTSNGGGVRTGDEPVRVFLYAHTYSLLAGGSLNTQAPDPVNETDANEGFLLPTVYTSDPNLPCCKFRNNEFMWRQSPGFVEYQEDGSWVVPGYPGLGGDVRIASPEITGFFYLSPNGATQTTPGRPGVVPGVGVHMRMNMGHWPSDDPSRLVAEGDTGTGYGEAAPSPGGGQTIVTRPGEDPVYEFRVPMRVVNAVIPASFETAPDRTERGFVVVVTVYQVEHPEGAFTQADWAIRTGHQYPPRVLMDVLRPLDTQDAQLHRGQGTVRVAWNITSVFGADDVDAASLRLTVDAPAVLEARLSKVEDWKGHHDHWSPVWVEWEIPTEAAGDGAYHVTATARNAQGTYEVRMNQTFEVRNGRILLPQEAAFKGSSFVPAFEALAAALAVTGVVAVRRLLRSGQEEL